MYIYKREYIVPVLYIKKYGYKSFHFFLEMNCSQIISLTTQNMHSSGKWHVSMVGFYPCIYSHTTTQVSLWRVNFFAFYQRKQRRNSQNNTKKRALSSTLFLSPSLSALKCDPARFVYFFHWNLFFVESQFMFNQFLIWNLFLFLVYYYFSFNFTIWFSFICTSSDFGIII